MLRRVPCTASMTFSSRVIGSTLVIWKDRASPSRARFAMLYRDDAVTGEFDIAAVRLQLAASAAPASVVLPAPLGPITA